MDCQEIRPLLDPFPEGELSPAEGRRVSDHLSGCADCRRRAAELSSLARALACLPRAEPPEGLAKRTLAAACSRARRAGPWPAWWALFQAVGAALALVLSLWVVAEALAAFDRAGGGEFLSLIHSHPHLLWHHPGDTAMALLEALPTANVALGLATAFVACLLAATATGWGWPRPQGRA